MHQMVIMIVFFSVYSGHHTILIPPGDLETNPALWLSAVAQHKGERPVDCQHLFLSLPSNSQFYHLQANIIGILFVFSS